MSEKLGNLVTQLSSLTAGEAADLSKQLEVKWGVSTSAPAIIPPGDPGTPPEVVTTRFNVMLTGFAPDKKMAVIKAVRELNPGLGLTESKALVETSPKPICFDRDAIDSGLLKKKLETAGGVVELQPV